MAQSLYCSPDQLQALSLTPAQFDRFNTVNPGCIEAMLLAMSSKADLYLTEQFELPLLEWDAQLSKVVSDMAAYELFISNGLAPMGGNVDQNILKRNQDAIDWLMHVSRKELHPNYQDSSSGQLSAGVYVLSNFPIGFV
jgi:phage gp36-like protein